MATHPSVDVSSSESSPISCTWPVWKQSLEWFITLVLETPLALMYSTVGGFSGVLCRKCELLDTLSRYLLPNASTLK